MFLKFLKFLGGCVIDLLIGMYYALAIKIIWNWFIPESFHLNPITYKMAIGLSMMIAIVRIRSGKFTDESEDVIELILTQIIRISILIGFAGMFKLIFF